MLRAPDHEGGLDLDTPDHTTLSRRSAAVDDILKLFGDRVADVVFQDGPLASDRDQTGDVIVVVRLDESGFRLP